MKLGITILTLLFGINATLIGQISNYVRNTLDSINMAFYQSNEVGYKLEYTYYGYCSEKNILEESEGLLLKSGDQLYFKQFGEEKLTTEKMAMVIDHDLETIKVFEQGINPDNVSVISNEWIGEISKYISRDTMEFIGGGVERLTLFTKQGGITEFHIEYESSTKKVKRVAFIFRAGNGYGFPEDACMQIQYKELRSVEVTKRMVGVSLGNYLTKNETGMWTQGEKFKSYKLIIL